MIGQTLGQYRILERLGEGGMGEVYRALDELLDREVALKMLRPELAHRADVLDRFRAEAVMLARLDHPNIARLHGLTRQDAHFFMVMEFVPGQTLLGRIQQGGRLPVRDAVGLLAGLLDGLEYAHQRGVIHRDVKPANVIVRPDGRVKITDFGIARVLGSERATRAGHIIGTLEYMAPEQIRGEDVDARADLYAAGVVFFELLSGRVPFTATTEYEIMRQQIEAPVPPLGQLVPDAPAWCEDVLAHALAKAPADRFASAAQFRDALLALAASEPATAAVKATRLVPMGMPATRLAQTPAAATRVAGAPAAPTRVSDAVAAAESRSRLSWRHGVSAAAVLVMIATAVVVWRGSAGREIVTPPPTNDTRVPGGGAAVPTVSRAPLSDPLPESPAAATPSPIAPTPEPPRPAKPRPSEAAPSTPVPSTPRPTPSEPSSPAPAEPSAPERVTPPAAHAAVRRPPARDPIDFKDIALLVVEGDKTRERDAILHLDTTGLSVIDKKTHAVLRNLSYAHIATATYSQSRHPRWKTATAGVALGGVFAVPLFFMKGTKHWLALEGSSDFIILRLDKDNFQSIIPEIQVRTGLTVAREAEK